MKLFWQKITVIPVFFTVLLQTLQNDPEMIKLNYNTSAENNGEQHKDNTNDITKYLEFHKDSILHLAKKHYENLVDALANDTINTASTSNYTFSFIFPNLSNQTDNYRTEDSEIYHE
jgi:hypothetical protein